MVTGITTQKAAMIRQPPPVTILPIFLSRPLLVSGMPIEREILDLAAEIPKNHFHENPPRFIFSFRKLKHFLCKILNIFFESYLVRPLRYPPYP